MDTKELELYDIRKDPEELEDISKSDIVNLNRMERKLHEFMEEKGYSDEYNDLNANKLELDKETVDILRGLGYAR